jgi:hypothetical protein
MLVFAAAVAASASGTTIMLRSSAALRITAPFWVSSDRDEGDATSRRTRMNQGNPYVLPKALMDA